MRASDSLPRPLRLALVITELRPGGAEKCLTNLALGLDRAEFAPQVFSLAAPPVGDRAVLVNRLREGGVPVEFLGVRHPWQIFRAVRRLRKLLRERTPHLVQSSLFHANAVTALAAAPLEIPLLAGLRVAQRERVRCWVDRTLAGRFAGYVCVSDDVAQAARRRLGVSDDRVHVIANGVCAAEFANIAPADTAALGVPRGRRVILFVGRLEAQKGADVLLETAPHFLPQFADCELVLAGEGRPSMVKRLLRLARRSGQDQRIHFVPWQADVRPLLAAADLVVVPSRWEGMSNTLLEAMAAGKAVVATDVEGARQVLGPLAEAQLAPPNDPSALAGRISEFLGHRERSSHLGHENRRRVLAEFDIGQMVNAYARLYRATIAGRIATSP